MTKEELYQLCKDTPLILDGATGTNLQKAGMPTGVCPELWIYEHEDVMRRLQEEYVAAGTKILYAPTFTANRIKLEEYGLSDRLTDINRKMVQISREAAAGKAFVAGDLTMTGQQLFPLGELPFEELVEVYKEQVRAILLEGVDLFVVETMMSLQECRAALLAITETCDLPVMISLTYNEDGRTLFGSEPDTAMIVLENMGAAVVGLNCSTGPKDMVPLVKKMRTYAGIPIMAKPNAGLPELIDGETVYRMTPETFAEEVKALVEAGAAVVGGCCGTTPAHIKALSDAVKNMTPAKPKPEKTRVLTSERKNVDIDPDGPFLVVGERINPTGKKALQAELRDGKLSMVADFARQQAADGAAVLDVNMGMNGIDEKEMMLRTVYEVSSIVDLPLCIDSSYPEVIEAALRIYPGRALINSISAEEEKLKALLPVAKKYGAMFILLPLSSGGLPKTIEEKHENIGTVMKAAEDMGIPRDRAVVDLLVATIGAEPAAALQCFSTVTFCKERNIPTVCGLSNISFGLPQRAFVNTAFLTIALSKGLTMAIANPSQELLMYTAFASDMLMTKDGATERYLAAVPAGAMTLTAGGSAGGAGGGVANGGESGSGAAAGSQKNNGAGDGSTDTENANASPLFDAVVKGSKDSIVSLCEKEIAAGKAPAELINEALIPAINLVGQYFADKKYFLPQLIGSANTMKEAMAYLEPLLMTEDTAAKETVIIATVEGDIHDIGKNLVSLMLKNYGYHVIDLGKDVPAEKIIDTAIEENAACIGLSALMTTTMMRMKEVVSLAKERGCQAKIFIGGACITESFAKEIGADAYAADAADAVRILPALLE